MEKFEKITLVIQSMDWKKTRLEANLIADGQVKHTWHKLGEQHGNWIGVRYSGGGVTSSSHSLMWCMKERKNLGRFRVSERGWH